VFALLFSILFVLHAPLLRLPYFWDEAGHYVPAARDLLLTGSLIPHSTTTNAHPPLVLAWLALWWKLSGYSAAVTRTAMLLVAALGLLAVFRLATNVANLPVAVAATVCTALYPVFFVESSLAQVDLAAAALSLWGIALLLEARHAWSGALFCLAVLAKETAIIVPVTIALWQLFWAVRRNRSAFAPPAERLSRTAVLALAPAMVLTAWYGYHYFRTGYVFGNPEFFRDNAVATLHPLRIVLAFLKRIWQVTGYMNLFLLTGAAAMAMTFPPLVDGEHPRPRVALDVQAILAVVIGAHIVCFSLIGGAALVRYMLPALPLILIICVSTIWRRIRQWPVVIGIVCAGFVLALFVNPPYPFAFEDNLAYRDYILLHRRAAGLLASRYARQRVLTAWPATDELSHPYVGYTKVAIPVVPIENFSAAEIIAAARDNSQYDMALLFSTKYQPAHDLFAGFHLWQRWQARFFGYHRDLPPEVAAPLLGGRIIFEESRNGQWVAVVEIERPQNAKQTVGPVSAPGQ
jgi:hypothetical protein